jgi:hypothetical protein
MRTEVPQTHLQLMVSQKSAARQLELRPAVAEAASVRMVQLPTPESAPTAVSLRRRGSRAFMTEGEGRGSFAFCAYEFVCGGGKGLRTCHTCCRSRSCVGG